MTTHLKLTSPACKFEDYVCSSLASVKYADYLLKTGKTDLSAVGSSRSFVEFGFVTV